MRNRASSFLKICSFLILLIPSFSFFEKGPSGKSILHFPYKAAGLTDRQAAAHLLSRFTYGATPGQVDEVIGIGMEKWFQQQLNADLPDDSLNKRLSSYDALNLTNAQVIHDFPKGFQVLKMAIEDGYINKDSVKTIKTDKKEYRELIASYMKQKGLRPEQELFRQFINQKVIRAAYSNNQLQEVLCDFWFNHFNVSITKNDCAQFIPSFERDVIRPNVTAKFNDLLLATAKSPAMLMYLDNFISVGTNTDFNNRGNAFNNKIIDQNNSGDSTRASLFRNLQNARKGQGLNENYAREVMELHTLGVDGGYTQNDVTQAARILTGWTVFPMSENGYLKQLKKIIQNIGEQNLIKRGFRHDGDFMFLINRHDNGPTTVLNKNFSGNSGYQEGVDLLNMLAHDPSTAKFICKKIAVRFVSDNPPQSLIDKMANTFLTKDGDIKQVLIAMVNAPEFWSKSVIRSKTKSPFELAISAVRALKADIQQPYQFFIWSDKMGEKIYYYQAPTGFPDQSQYWINTGALLNRMNFGLAIASQRIPGTKVDLLAMNNHHEPESATSALTTYGKLMLPERDLSNTIKRLTPLLNDPGLVKRIAEAASKTPTPATINISNLPENNMNTEMNTDDKGRAEKKEDHIIQYTAANHNMLTQVVGIIIGSPEFQRR